MVPAARSQATPWFSRVGTSVARSGCHRRLASSRVSPAYRAASTWAAASSSLKRGAKLLGDSQSPTVTVPPSCRAGSGRYAPAPAHGPGRAPIGVPQARLLQPTSPSAHHASTPPPLPPPAPALQPLDEP